MTTRGGFNTKSPTVRRILQESKEMARHPDPCMTAAPLEDNLFEWHFTIAGPPSSPYETGIYHGRVILPPSYPLRPPMFRFMNPSGRFEVNREICLSISGHHEETWQPAWGIRTALCAIRAFMESDAKGQVGGLDATEPARRRMAAESRKWRCPICSADSGTLEDVIKECARQWEEAKKSGDINNDDTERNAIPDELRLAYKDELTAESKQQAQKMPTSSASSESAEASRSQMSRTSAEIIDRRPSQPASQSVRLPPASSSAITRQITNPRSSQQGLTVTQQAARRALHQQPAENVPAWIDKAIYGVIACLLFVLMKKVFT